MAECVALLKKKRKVGKLMKKIIAALVVLAIAVPAFGAVSITATQISGSEVQISYSGADGGNPVRGFGIDVTVDSSAIVDYNNTTTSTDYQIFPGSVQVDAFGNISSYGTPIGNPADHPDTEDGLGSGGVTLEMGSLYETTPPATSGDLVVLEVDGDCNMSMAGNAARGNVVLEDGTAGTTYDGTRIWYSTLNRAEFDVWKNTWGGGNAANAPKNWRGWCWKCGDVDGDGIVLPGDVLAVFNYFKDATSNGEGDVDMDGIELPGDVLLAFNSFSGGADCTPCLPSY